MAVGGRKKSVVPIWTHGFSLADIYGTPVGRTISRAAKANRHHRNIRQHTHKANPNPKGVTVAFSLTPSGCLDLLGSACLAVIKERVGLLWTTPSSNLSTARYYSHQPPHSKIRKRLSFASVNCTATRGMPMVWQTSSPSLARS
jgi:hypothetical protein